MSYDFWQYKLNKLYKPLVKYYIQEYSKVLDALANDTDRDQLIWRFSDFFSLYFSNGDFWYFKNKFSSYEYRIPYSGKDTEFRWATKDCYYVKTSDVVNDMQVDLGSLFEGKQWTLKLFKKTRSESDSSGNEVFRFDVQIEDIVDEETDELTWYSVIFYNYEEDKTLKAKQKDEKIAEVLLTKGIKAKDPAVAKTLWDFLTKRGRDYFIHKRLKTFLTEELEWYFFQLLKHDVQGKVDILTLQNKIAEIKLKYQDDQEVIDMKIAKLMSESGSLSGNNYQLAYIWILNFINILADLEEFKAKLWNKERKVIKQEYCISLSKIPTEYHSEVLANSTQQRERKDLGMTAGTNGLFTEDQSLVVDTKYYSWAIREKLLHLAQSQEVTGRLIKSDNYQALQWMQKEYTDQIKCVYIDPPYNTENDRKEGKFMYKDSYEYSSWNALMYDRLLLINKVLSDKGIFYCSIDDYEVAELKLMTMDIFWRDNIVWQLPTIMNLKWNNDEFGFAWTHEYTLCAVKNKSKALVYEFSISEEEEEDWSTDEQWPYKKWAWLKATWWNAPRDKRPNLFYPIFISQDNTVYVTDDNNPINSRDYVIYPITNWVEMSWRWEKKKVKKDINDVIVVGENGEFTLYKKQRPSLWDVPSKKPKTILYKPEYSSWNGTASIKSLFWSVVFKNPKPVELVKDLIQVWAWDGDLVLDLFAWSWSSAEAVLRLNMDTDSKRKFILIELGEYFNSVIIPRIKKILYSQNRKDAKAMDNYWTSWLIEYLYLNQYEDRFADNGYLKTLEWEINTLAQTEVTTQTDIKHILHPLRELLDKIYTIDDHL